MGKADASDVLQHWSKGHPEDMSVAMVLAGAYQAEKRNKDAITQYERVLQIQPQNVVALNNLAWLYIVEGRYAEAEELSRKALMIYETKLGKDNQAYVAYILFNLANV